MDVTTGDLSALVFKRVPAQNIGEFSLDGRMLSVLMEVDGRQNVAAIAKKLGINMGTIRPVISALLDLKLIEAGEDALSVLDPEFLEVLTEGRPEGWKPYIYRRLFYTSTPELGEAPFAHDYEHVEQLTFEDDYAYGFKDLHKIRAKVEPQAPSWPKTFDESVYASQAWKNVERYARAWPREK